MASTESGGAAKAGTEHNGGANGNGTAGRSGPIDRDSGRGIRDQIERYRTAFLAIVVMVLVAAASAGYILAHERLSVPAWVPIIGRESFVLRGEFSTGQAVTPGQGQQVTIAGAKIGEISSVELHGERALVSMDVTPAYARYIYRDATALLRPKTGLKDETVEISPGSPATGKVPHGFTIPIAQTSPDGNLDEFLGALDTETRSYLQELLAGAAGGLQGNSANLSATLKRFDPLARDFTEIGREVARRQDTVARGIHNFRLVVEALGGKDSQLAQLVDSANSVLGAFAEQNRAVQATLHQLPAVLTEANHSFGKLATAVHVTGSTLHELEPFAKDLAPTNRALQPAFKETTSILHNELRPLFRQILPVINQFQPSLQDFAQAAPQLTTSFTVLNELFNELAYNPGASQAGFGFFADWGSHDLDSTVALGEAHGAVGQTLLYFNCEVLPILEGVEQIDPTARLQLKLLNPPSEKECQAAATHGAAAKAAGLRDGVNSEARLADRLFGQGPDAAALAPALGGGH
jgi:phospholipid/cholesterol/gamma-HCH transport system substrate-binding protein